MKNFRSKLKFDKDFLNELIAAPASGVEKQQYKYHIALHPAQLNDFGGSVREELGRRIGKYDQTFKGILLGFTDIKLLSQLGAIGIDNCYIHLDVQAYFFIFKPEIGMLLKGIVTRNTINHVGCLVYNTFNISLPKPDDDQPWLGEQVSAASEVEFKISYVDLDARLPYIRGDLCKILNGEMSGNKGELHRPANKKRFSISDDNIEPTKSPKKKHKNIDQEAPVKDEDIPKKVKKKHKRKEKTKNEDSDVSLESLDLKSLFSNTSLDLDADQSTSQSADNGDKRKKRKRSQSLTQEPYIEQIKLEADSDLEKIIA